MPRPRDWAGPFLEQAREDRRAAEATYSSKIPSTFCMLMQMTFEKLAKAALARKNIQPPRSHQVASRLLLLLQRMLGGPLLPGVSTTLTFAAIRELENAQPAVVSHAVSQGSAQYPQLEYPWENPVTHLVEWPARHLPIARRVADPGTLLVLSFSSWLELLKAGSIFFFPELGRQTLGGAASPRSSTVGQIRRSSKSPREQQPVACQDHHALDLVRGCRPGVPRPREHCQGLLRQPSGGSAEAFESAAGAVR